MIVPQISTFGNEIQLFCTIVPPIGLFGDEARLFSTIVPKTSTFGTVQSQNPYKYLNLG